MKAASLLLFWLATLALPAPGAGQSSAQGLHVEQPWARRASMLAGTGSSAAYGIVVNSGSRADALVSASSDVAEATEVHESYQSSAGVVGMRQIQRIDVPPGGRIEMKPGGYHIMLIRLKRDLSPGTAVNLVLEFDKAGRIPVQATVR